MSRPVAFRALVLATLALVIGAVGACVIGPKPDDPLTGGDTNAAPDGGEDSAFAMDVGAVPGDTGAASDAAPGAIPDAALDASDASDTGDAGDAPDVGGDASGDDADPSTTEGGAATDGASEGAAG